MERGLIISFYGTQRHKSTKSYALNEDTKLAQQDLCVFCTEELLRVFVSLCFVLIILGYPLSRPAAHSLNSYAWSGHVSLAPRHQPPCSVVTKFLLRGNKFLTARTKTISKPWKYISEALKYILVPLKYISVPLKKFCSLRREKCVRFFVLFFA